MLDFLQVFFVLWSAFLNSKAVESISSFPIFFFGQFFAPQFALDQFKSKNFYGNLLFINVVWDCSLQSDNIFRVRILCKMKKRTEFCSDNQIPRFWVHVENWNQDDRSSLLVFFFFSNIKLYCSFFSWKHSRKLLTLKLYFSPFLAKPLGNEN